MTAPKKEAAPKKEKAPKEAPSPKKKEEKKDDEEEDDVPKEKAPKHPLGALPPSTIPIDEWKRQYSNNDTPVALKWFWEHYDPKEFSLWRLDYKVLPLTPLCGKADFLLVPRGPWLDIPNVKFGHRFVH
jgi:elongation factor 1-gamma